MLQSRRDPMTNEQAPSADCSRLETLLLLQLLQNYQLSSVAHLGIFAPRQLCKMPSALPDPSASTPIIQGSKFSPSPGFSSAHISFLVPDSLPHLWLSWIKQVYIINTAICQKAMVSSIFNNLPGRQIMPPVSDSGLVCLRLNRPLLPARCWLWVLGPACDGAARFIATLATLGPCVRRSV